MQIWNSIGAVRAWRGGINGRVGLVPTMGSLHAGHLSLIKAARAASDVVVVSLFVNPTQFSQHEDFDRYPRNLPADMTMLEGQNVDALFAPINAMEMYPHQYRTFINVEELSKGLEGSARPDHFRGVATVVAKLFNVIQPTGAYFGQKDAQQAVVVRRMARDLNFPVHIEICPTVRETDGLAMSSRNRFLNADQRHAAPVIYRALQAAAAVYDAGERKPDAIRRAARDVLATEPLADVDYVALTDPGTLRGVLEMSDQPILLSIAVKFGETRLLDNALLPWSLNAPPHLTSILGGM